MKLRSSCAKFFVAPRFLGSLPLLYFDVINPSNGQHCVGFINFSTLSTHTRSRARTHLCSDNLPMQFLLNISFQPLYCKWLCYVWQQKFLKQLFAISLALVSLHFPHTPMQSIIKWNGVYAPDLACLKLADLTVTTIYPRLYLLNSNEPISSEYILCLPRNGMAYIISHSQFTWTTPSPEFTRSLIWFWRVLFPLRQFWHWFPCSDFLQRISNNVGPTYSYSCIDRKNCSWRNVTLFKYCLCNPKNLTKQVVKVLCETQFNWISYAH